MNLIQSIAPVLASHAANSLVLGFAIAFLVWAALKAMSGANSAARFAVLYSALVAIAALLFFWHSPSESGFSGAHSSGLTFSSKWAVYVLYAWAAITIAGLLRITTGLRRLHHLRRTFIPMDLPELRSMLEQRQVASKRRVQIFHSPEVRVPAAIGFFRPAVVLPSWSLEELSPEELNASIVHELAHVDRWDDWTNLAQKIIRAILFFHPAIWWLDSQLAIEREMSCDDAVLAQTEGPERYAQCLVSLAERALGRHPISLVHAAVGRMTQTALRIGRILDGKKRKTASSWKPAVAALAAFSIVGGIAFEHTPQLIAFQTSARAGEQTPAAPRLATLPNDRSLCLVMPATMRNGISQSVGHNNSSSAIAVNHAATHHQPQPYEMFAVNSGHGTVVNARANAPAEFMYVVMETRDYDGSGTMRVTTSVWRLRLVVPPLMRMESAAPPHST